jgi:hypothetical protein
MTITRQAYARLTELKHVSPHRTFRDDAERLWNAWDVTPAWGERRRHDRRQRSEDPPKVDERRRLDRRHLRGIRISLPPMLAKGWVAFECDADRRRIAPIPPGWHELPEPELVHLWRNAERLPPRRKGLVE